MRSERIVEAVDIFKNAKLQLIKGRVRLSVSFWLSVMNDLKNRGVKDVYVFCVDGLAGFR